MPEELPVIDNETAKSYLLSLQHYLMRDQDGEPIPDDGLTMVADLIQWAENVS